MKTPTQGPVLFFRWQTGEDNEGGGGGADDSGRAWLLGTAVSQEQTFVFNEPLRLGGGSVRS